MSKGLSPSTFLLTSSWNQGAHFHTRLVLVLILGWIALLGLPAQAHRQGMFATKAEAGKRAVELHCQGVFAMGEGWMPCSSERALHEALQQER